MKNKQIETIIWSAVMKSVCTHSKIESKWQKVKPETKIRELFPTKNGKDEHANRLGVAMIDLFYYFNKKFNLKLKVDYAPREEFALFPDIESVYLYWYARVTGIDQPANKVEVFQ